MIGSSGSGLRSSRRWAATPSGGLAAVISVSVLLGTPGAVYAQEAPSAEQMVETTISVAFEPSQVAGLPHYLVARLLADDGSAVVREQVRISRLADAFGGRVVTIGRAWTDNAGVARVPVEPRETVYAITASFRGSETLAPSEVQDDIVFPVELVILPEHAPRGGLVDPQLRPLADAMPIVIGSAVSMIWLVLLGLTVLTIRRIRSSGASDLPAPDQDSAESPGMDPGPQG